MSSLPIAVMYRSRTSRSRNCRIGRQAVALQLDVAESGIFDSFVEALKGVLSEHWQRKTFDSQSITPVSGFTPRLQTPRKSSLMN